jgi:hypothetical protein
MDSATFEVLERIATALEKSAEVQEKDFNFRVKAAQEQAELVQRLTNPDPVPAGFGAQRRARRT